MSIQSKLYFRKWPSSDWLLQGTTTGTGEQSFDLLDFEDWSDWEDWNGINCLQSGYKYEWRIDTYNTETGLTTTGDTWSFITPITRIWFHRRYFNFDANYFWQQSTEDWLDEGELELYEMDAGRLKRNLIAVNNKGDIFFSEV